LEDGCFHGNTSFSRWPILPARPMLIQTWYYPGIAQTYGCAAQRTRRFPPIPAAAAAAGGRRPADDAPATHARAAPRGSGRIGWDRRRLVRAAGTGARRQ